MRLAALFSKLRAGRGRCPRRRPRPALLHDLFELCPTTGQRLRDEGLTCTELEALELLRHAADESYEAYVQRIADALGPAGRLALIVKLADLEDHLAHPSIPSDAPPHAWARTHLLTARD